VTGGWKVGASGCLVAVSSGHGVCAELSVGSKVSKALVNATQIKATPRIKPTTRFAGMCKTP
jgi:hypothetical protein